MRVQLYPGGKPVDEIRKRFAENEFRRKTPLNDLRVILHDHANRTRQPFLQHNAQPFSVKKDGNACLTTIYNI